MNARPPGQVLTFYSYKGGTGRTLALANVAWILASNGKRVLTIDWDLEAPGLHRFFAPFLHDPKLEQTDGLVEFLSAYMVAATKSPVEDTSGSERPWYVSYADVRRFAEPIQWRFPEGGSIDLLGAGRQVSSYGMRVNNFDWNGFYSRFGGGAFLDECVRQMREAYDFVLVDSRTGISDTSGICTVHLPDTLVIFYTLNNQSIEGASGIARDVSGQRHKSASDKPFRVFPVATRVELAEKDKLEARRLLARNRFESLLETIPELSPTQRETYWGEMEVLYDPYYAYEEVLAAIADSPNCQNSVLATFQRLTGYLTNGEITRLGEMSEGKRQEALEAYARLGSPTLKPNVGPRRTSDTWDVFISASHVDREPAERLYYLLEPSYKVFHAPRSIQPGEAWEPALRNAIDHSQTMLILFSAKSAASESKWLSAEIQAALERHEKDPSFRIVPLQLDSGAAPSGDIGDKLNRFQWLSAPDGDVQLAAASIHQLLGPGRESATDAEREARLGSELKQALAEKTDLNDKMTSLKEEITRLAQQKGALEEKTLRFQKDIETAANETEALKAKEAKTLRALGLFRSASILAVVVVGSLGANSYFSVRRAQQDAGRHTAQAAYLISENTDLQREVANLSVAIGEKQTQLSRKEEELKAAADTWENIRRLLTESTDQQAVPPSLQGRMASILASVDSRRRELSWETVASETWVKPGEVFDAKHHLQIDVGVYLWPVKLLGEASAEIVVNDSPKGSERGEKLQQKGVLGTDSKFLVKSSDYEYRIRLAKIDRVSSAPTSALFITAERRSRIGQTKSTADQKALQTQE
jgi:MinD-like ATPase involved in chromosome partitioning or flagellar assembly/predicted  nucleic acid-binding Zn-ribbon protein